MADAYWAYQSSSLETKMDDLRALGTTECGEEASKHFMFDKNYRNFNHGSFGTYPKHIRPVLQYFQHLSEARPDEYIRWTYHKYLDDSRHAAAKLLNASPQDCVFVPNATTGVNTVLRNLTFSPGNVVITFPTIYAACANTVTYLTETTPVEVHKIHYEYPVSDAYICEAFESALASLREAGKTPRVAIFDTIVSMPGVRMPFQQLTALCKKHDVMSLIDGAHGIGHIPLDLSELDPDFFVSNCHKWLDVPRGCAIFYVPERNQAAMRSTLPTSHGFQPLPDDEQWGLFRPVTSPAAMTSQGQFHLNFDFVGTVDTSPYCCVRAALEWRSRVTWKGLKGEEAHMGYCMWLAKKAGEIVAGALGTEVLSNAGCDGQGRDTLGECNFANVRLPLDAKELCGGDVDQEVVAKIGVWTTDTLFREYHSALMGAFYAGNWWIRLSAQVYLTEQDFEWAGKVLKEVCGRINKGEWKTR